MTRPGSRDLLYSLAILVMSAVFAEHAAALTPLAVYATVSPGTASGPGFASGSGPLCPTGPSCGSYSDLAEATGVDGGEAHAIVTLSGVPLSLAGQQGIATSAQADVYYGIQLAGASGVTVPVYIGSLLSALPVSGILSNQATLTVTSQVYGTAYTKTCYNGSCFDSAPPYSSGEVSGGGSSGPAYLVSGFEYIVHLQASAYAGYDGTAEAKVDPTFTVDPAFASRFELFGVPGAVSTAVPEPAAWILLLVGFGVVAAAMRRYRRAAAALLPTSGEFLGFRQ